MDGPSVEAHRYFSSPPLVQSPGYEAASPSQARHPRLWYSEEEKFFIMYMRIIHRHAWPTIEAEFVRLFGAECLRSKDGLTSVYYRVRKEWGLEDVLRSAAPDAAREDREAVERKARCFTIDVLRHVGYLT